MIGSFLATLKRELRIAARHGSEWLLPLIFFAVVVMLFALGAKPKDPSLQAFAPSILWVCALLAALLTTERLFQPIANGFTEYLRARAGKPFG